MILQLLSFLRSKALSCFLVNVLDIFLHFLALHTFWLADMTCAACSPFAYQTQLPGLGEIKVKEAVVKPLGKTVHVLAAGGSVHILPAGNQGHIILIRERSLMLQCTDLCILRTAVEIVHVPEGHLYCMQTVHNTFLFSEKQHPHIGEFINKLPGICRG